MFLVKVLKILGRVGTHYMHKIIFFPERDSEESILYVHFFKICFLVVDFFSISLVFYGFAN